MSYANLLKSAAALAQSVLAPMCDPEGEGEFTLGGTTYTGTMNEQNEVDPLDATGIRRIRELFIYATKAQFASAPDTAPRLTLTAKGITWAVQSVTNLPQHYRFTCRPAS